MNSIVSHDATFRRLYNCDNFTSDEWTFKGNPNRLIAELYLGTGAIYLATYVPVLFVMAQPRLMQMACYKMLFLLGLIDVFEVLFNCIVAGLLQWNGYIFCSAPTFNYYLGALITGLWCATCCGCVILCINRIVEMWKKTAVFSGLKVWLWLLLPVLCFFCALWFSQPLIFTSHYYGFISNPHTNLLGGEEDNGEYGSHVFNVINAFFALITVSLLPILIGMMCNKAETIGSARVKTATYQTIVICFLKLAPSVFFALNHFVPFNATLILAGQITLQAAHGLPGLIYLAVNKTIRGGVLYVFGVESVNMAKATSHSQLDENDLEVPHNVPNVWSSQNDSSASTTQA